MPHQVGSTRRHFDLNSWQLSAIAGTVLSLEKTCIHVKETVLLLLLMESSLQVFYLLEIEAVRVSVNDVFVRRFNNLLLLLSDKKGLWFPCFAAAFASGGLSLVLNGGLLAVEDHLKAFYVHTFLY